MADESEAFLSSHAPKVKISHLDVNYSLNDRDLSTKGNSISINDPYTSSISSTPLDSTEDIIEYHLQKQSFFDKYFGRRSMKGAVFNLIVAVVGVCISSNDA